MSDRRGFLRGLVSLPLIGGGLTLIGSPTAAAVPVTPDLLEGYKTWLHYESRFLAWEMADRPDVIERYQLAAEPHKIPRYETIRGCILHAGNCADQRDDEPPSTRAAVVLSAVGRSPHKHGRC